MKTSTSTSRRAPAGSPVKVRVQDLGLIDYEKAWALQKERVDAVIQGEPSTIFLCEHPAVLTLGRLAAPEHILTPAAELNRRGIRVVPIDRGGEVTLHAPGQLVVYPVLDLSRFKKDLKYYVYQLEEVAIDFLKGFGIMSDRISGKTGVWVGEKKIVSIGIGVRKWVSFHGLALNVRTDPDLFSLIRPCGMDIRMTTLKELTGRDTAVDAVKPALLNAFHRVFATESVDD